jgi:hypothetical protein
MTTTLTLLDLPVEIRLEIYDLLLVSPLDRDQKTSWAITKAYKKITVQVNVLRTCKQVYYEAVSILYSRNLFRIASPKESLEFISQIGPANAKNIRSMFIAVYNTVGLAEWMKFFDVLVEQVTGLRSLELHWSVLYGAPPIVIGFGNDVNFIRSLARIQGLRALRISGFFAKNWTSYMSEKMNVQVQAQGGYVVAKESKGMEIYMREGVKKFKAYQEGTENLFP